MARKPYEILGGDTPFIWDNTTVLAPGCSATIVATEEEFRTVGNYLYSMIAVRWPDENNVEDTGRPINNLNETLRNSIARIARQLQIATITCLEIDDMKLRQKPDNDCILQQFQEGVWIDVFDYSLCMLPLVENVQVSNAKSEMQSVSEIANQIMEEFNDRYTGTSASYNPKLTMDHPEGENRRQALCEALFETAKGYNEATKKLKENEADSINRASVVLGVGVAIVGILATIASFGVFGVAIGVLVLDFMALGSAAIAGGVVGLTTAGLAAWAEVVRGTAKEVYEDELALREYVCLWHESFDGVDDINAAAFAASVDVSGAIHENTSYFETAFVFLRTQPLAYAAFLKTWTRSIELSENGVVPDCPCAEPEILIVASSGWPQSMVQYEGAYFEHESYIITTGSTGHYATGSIKAADGSAPFYIIDAIPLDAGWENGQLLVAGHGYYKLNNDDFTVYPMATPTSQVGLYFGVGQFRLIVSPDPVTPPPEP